MNRIISMKTPRSERGCPTRTEQLSGRQIGMSRWARLFSALAAFIIAIVIIAPLTFTEPVNVDEDQYIWSAAYFGGKVLGLDFSPVGSDDETGPGWSPSAWWSLTQPMGTRLLYAPVLGLTSAE